MSQIVFVTNSLSGGGAERASNIVVNSLHAMGHQVAIIPVNESSPDFISPNCQVFPIGRTSSAGVLGLFIAFIRFQLIIWKLKPKTVVLNCDLPELFGALLLARIKIIAVEHSEIPWEKHQTLGKLVRGLLTTRACTWVAVSSHLSIWPKGNEPSLVIRNPIKTAELFGAPDTGDVVQRLIFIGRLSEEKDPMLVLEIARKTKLGVLFIGDGRLQDKLIENARLLEVRAIFKGWVINPWLEVNGGDLLIVPSKSEGDGLIVIEAIQNRVPILLSQINSFANLRLPDTNYCNEIDDYVAAINLNLNKRNSLIVPERTRLEILESRDEKKVGMEWLSLLNSL
jgi:glycosyltransferase involved in cell wall biosynthesis